MPCIRRKYHGTAVYLSPEISDGKSPLCGQTVQVIKNNTWENDPFLGFSTVESVARNGGAIITGVTGFTTGDQYFGYWIDLHFNDWLLASREDNGVKLVVYNERPLVITDQTIPDDKINLYQNNVYRLKYDLK